MSATAFSSRQPAASSAASAPANKPRAAAKIVRWPAEHPDCSFVDLGDSTRVAFMLRPASRGSTIEQVQEVLARIGAVLSGQGKPMFVTNQTVFLRDAADQKICEQLFVEFYGRNYPVTNFVLQPPHAGAALAMEAWAIGGDDVKLEPCGSHALAVTYNSARWIYVGGLAVPENAQGAYAQTHTALERMAAQLEEAGATMENVVRTWFYLGQITEPEANTQRYKELNRARTDFYRDVKFCCALLDPGIPHGIYPASTGIGMAGLGLVAGCVALQTDRKDAFVLPLENPQQTPAYAYHRKYSPDSPKFSRAVALGLGDHLTTWISGTASIVNSESRHLGDIVRQTELTIENIEKLISPENFAFNGAKAAGARLNDLAKIRVYVKRAEDIAACRATCQRLLGEVPAIYAVADVCRPELLVEIEGVAFSQRNGSANESKANVPFDQ